MRDYQSLGQAIDNTLPSEEELNPTLRYAQAVTPVEDKTAPVPVEQDTDWLEYAGKSADAHWIKLSELGGQEFGDEEGYDGLSEENKKLIPESFSVEQMEDVMRANSSEERDYLIGEFEQNNQLMMELAQGGLPGMGVQLATAMFDPTALGAVLLSEGLAAPWVMAAKTTRMATIMSRMGKAGVVAAGTEAGLSGMRMASDVNYRIEDAMLDVTLAATLGTGLGWMARPTRQVVDAQLEARALSEAGETVAEGEARSVGAAETDFSQFEEDGVAFEKARIDHLASISKSGNNEARRVAKEMLEDVVYDNKKGDVANHTAALQAHMDRKHYTTRFNKTVDDSMKEWMKEQGVTLKNRILNPIETHKLQQDFSQQMYRAMEVGDVDNPHVMKAVSELKKQTDELYDLAQRAGLEGFEGDATHLNYMKRKWNFTKVAAMSAEDPERAFNLIYDGLKSGARKAGRYDEVEDVASFEAYLKAMAIGFNQRAKHMKFADDYDFGDVLVGNVDTGQFLRDTLTLADVKRIFKGEELDALMGKTEDEVLNIATKKLMEKAFKTKASKKGSPNTIDRGKVRMDLDLSVRNGDTQLSDLFDNDAIGLHQSYIREITGWSSLAQNVKSRQLRGKSDWNKMLKAVATEENKNKIAKGDLSADDKGYRKLEKQLEQARKEIFGENVYDMEDGAFTRSLNLARRYNFTTSMGMAAMSALSEMGRVYAEGGLKNTLRNTPELGKILKASFKQGEGKTLAAEVNSFGASFGDEHLMTALSGFDGDVLSDYSRMNNWDKADIISQKAQRVMAQVSLLAPVDRTMRQLSFSTRHTAFYRHFKYGEKLKFAPEEYGLTKADMDALKDEFVNHTTEGKLGGVDKTGIQNWNPELRQKYLRAMTRADAKAVQSMIAGQSPMWLEHPLGRVFMQFRTFVLNSYSKHFLADFNALIHGNNNTRATALVSIGMSGIMASLAYKMRVEANALGRDDADAYRKRMLEDNNALIKNTINYMPIAGSGTTAWNMSVGMVKPDWSMDIFRSTGGSAKGLTSFALGDKFDRLGSVGRNAFADEDSRNRYGSSVARQLAPFIMFGNTLPGALAINQLEKLEKD